MGVWGLELAGNEGMENKMKTTIMGNIGTAIRIHSFTANQRQVKLSLKYLRLKSECLRSFPEATGPLSKTTTYQFAECLKP